MSGRVTLVAEGSAAGVTDAGAGIVRSHGLVVSNLLMNFGGHVVPVGIVRGEEFGPVFIGDNWLGYIV